MALALEVIDDESLNPAAWREELRVLVLEPEQAELGSVGRMKQCSCLERTRPLDPCVYCSLCSFFHG